MKSGGKIDGQMSSQSPCVCIIVHSSFDIQYQDCAESNELSVHYLGNYLERSGTGLHEYNPAWKD
jgi:hypothetical protein